MDIERQKGKSTSPDIRNFIQKLNKKLLLPCPCSADDLEMPQKSTAPREMNSFIVFRRQLAYVAKQLKISDDGKFLSTAATYIWNGANKEEKQSYTQIAEELKRRHRLRFPDYTYERRKKRTNDEDFIIIDANTIAKPRPIKKRRKSSQTIEASPVLIPEEQETSISIQEKEHGDWLCQPVLYNQLISQDDTFGTLFTNNEYYDEYSGIREDQIPQLCQMVMSPFYLDVSPQDMQLQQQQLQQIYLESLQPVQQTSSFDGFYYGNADVSINYQPSSN
ncbi:hypothetical protein C1645_806588 [Glomus cerebriforme]|uniref:HMG box domain-containing protein n=1 Tax=Glomus cerebriforme TaxID=658196 RepID=A0A397SXU6_9GLOM|nr:hypothetical protein C1645_806588 [Glomus cerebriforme]